MAAINFYINTGGADYDIELGPSGLGFYGDAGFGASVPVGTYQGRTFVTDGNGVSQGPEAQNVKWQNAGSGILGQTGSGIGLQAIPNYQATLNIRFSHDSAVQTQSAEMRIYDRSDINEGAVGVTTKAAEIIHPNVTQGPTGSGDSQWITPAGSGTTLSLANSPGRSGEWAGDGVSVVSSRPDLIHDWYVALSASPDSIGSKTSYGLYVSLEYL